MQKPSLLVIRATVWNPGVCLCMVSLRGGQYRFSLGLARSQSRNRVFKTQWIGICVGPDSTFDSSAFTQAGMYSTRSARASVLYIVHTHNIDQERSQRHHQNSDSLPTSALFLARWKIKTRRGGRDHQRHSHAAATPPPPPPTQP